jgi:hypothetical protein
MTVALPSALIWPKPARHPSASVRRNHALHAHARGPGAACPLARWVCAVWLATGCGSVKAVTDATGPPDASPPDAPIRCNDGVRAAGEVCFVSLMIQQAATVIDAQLADADGDGDLDLGYVLGDKLALQFQNAGAFGPVVTSTTQPTTFLLMRDFTGDRKADMVSVAPGGPTSLVTFLGDGLGGQQPVYVDQTAGVSHGLAMVNIDGIGPDELVQFDDAKVQVFAVGAGAVLSDLGDITSVGLSAGAAGKLDGDALADVVIAVPGGVFLRRGMTFGLGPAEAIGVTRAVTALAIGDVDGDGKPDVVYAHDGTVGVMRGDGTGGFTAGPTKAIPGAGRLLELADIDGDGRADVISPNGAMLEVALGQADGALGDPHEIALIGEPASIHADQDINGDHAPDIVITSGMTITILTSQP